MLKNGLRYPDDKFLKVFKKFYTLLITFLKVEMSKNYYSLIINKHVTKNKRRYLDNVFLKIQVLY